MNRRHFLAATTAASGLISATAAAGPRVERLKILIPKTPPERLKELKAVAPNAELVECASEAEAVAQCHDAAASYGLISCPTAS